MFLRIFALAALLTAFNLCAMWDSSACIFFKSTHASVHCLRQFALVPLNFNPQVCTKWISFAVKTSCQFLGVSSPSKHKPCDTKVLYHYWIDLFTCHAVHGLLKLAWKNPSNSQEKAWISNCLKSTNPDLRSRSSHRPYYHFPLPPVCFQHDCSALLLGKVKWQPCVHHN